MSEGRRPIDEGKLRRIRTTAQVLAVASLAAFGALIAYSAYRLHGIQKELRRSSDELTSQQTELAATAAKKADLEREVAELEKKSQTLTSTLQDFTTRVDAKNWRLAIDATSAAIEANPEVAALLPRIYLHIGDERQRQAAHEVGLRLQRAGFLIPGVEYVGPGRSPRSTTLKQFRQSDQDDEDVAKAVAALREAGVPAEVSLQKLKDSVRVRQRQYELWFGSDFPPSTMTRAVAKRLDDPATSASRPTP